MKTLNDYMAISYRMKIDQFRLEKAFLELKNTDKTVLEISQEAGFDNLSNFKILTDCGGGEESVYCKWTVEYGSDNPEVCQSLHGAFCGA